MTLFKQFSFRETTFKSIEQLGYETPTPIQEQAIPEILAGHDVLASAQTGTGKTAAFSLPLIDNIAGDLNQLALILTPTRELATQVHAAIQSMSRHSDIRSCLIVGGKPMYQQIKQIKKRPQIIVGTPGRILDLLQQKALNITKLNTLVLDEMDRMLDMGFSIQIDAILDYTSNERQTLMFSATLPKAVMKLVKKYLKTHKTISVGPTNQPIDAIETSCIQVQQVDKNAQLVDILSQRSGSTIVFVRTKHQTERIAKLLEKKDIKAGAFQGDLSQRKRERVLKQFKQQNISVLVATDIAARGIDIDHVSLVINLDLPQDPEDYIHRIGRTGRAGATGEAISFVAPHEKRLWHAIEVMLGIKKASDKPPGGKPSKRRRPAKNAGKRPFGKKHSERQSQDRNTKRPDTKKKPFTKKASEGKKPGQRRSTSNKDANAKPTRKPSNDKRANQRPQKGNKPNSRFKTKRGNQERH